jgi:hypothetical protein
MGWFCVALTTGYLITNHVVLPLYTKPLDYYWNQWYGAEGVIQVDEAKVSGRRNLEPAFADQLQFYLGVGIINLFGDICILTVPISSVIKLRLEKTQKIAILLIFMLGSLYVNPTSTTSTPLWRQILQSRVVQGPRC